jgi:hypothetical protein
MQFTHTFVSCSNTIIQKIEKSRRRGATLTSAGAADKLELEPSCYFTSWFNLKVSDLLNSVSNVMETERDNLCQQLSSEEKSVRRATLIDLRKNERKGMNWWTDIFIY